MGNNEADSAQLLGKAYDHDQDRSALGPSPVELNSSYPPRLASTITSREFAYDADSDTISDQGAADSALTDSPNDPELSPLGLRGGEIRSAGQLPAPPNDRGVYELANQEEPLLSNDQNKTFGSDDYSPRSDGFDFNNLLDSGSGMVAGIANLSNSILGAGIIGLPYALKNAGFLTGTVMIVVLGFITDWSIRLIALNSKLTGQRTYIGILERCFGFPGKAAVSFFQFIFAFGGMCAFGVIVGDTIPPVLSALFPFITRSTFFSFLFSRSFVICFFTLTISFPLSLYRDISKLSKASALALVSMIVIVCSVAFGGPLVDKSTKGDPNSRWTLVQPGVVEAIGVISFAFVCHHNSLLIYGSLKTPTLDRFAKVIHVSTALSVVACLTMSFSGFLTFTDRTQANILNNFPSDDFMINIARVCFGLNMFTTLPLECFVCRETIETFFYEHEPYNQKRHVLYTSVLVIGALIISLSTCDLGIVLELTGGLAASALAYVFPAACQLKLTTETIYQRKNLPALLTVIFGLMVMLISTGGTLFKALDPNRPAKICHH